MSTMPQLSAGGRARLPTPAWPDTLVFWGVRGLTLVAVVALLLPALHIVFHGAGMLSLDFITQVPTESGRAGGIASILVSTAVIVAISMAAALPLALATAIVLSEYLSRSKVLRPLMRGSLDILAGVPSVVFGLFGLALFCRQLGLGYSLLAGGLTLGCMILPVLAQTFCAALEATGDQYRTAARALGLTRAATIWHLSLPVALQGLTAGCVLGLTRALAETAVLLFTSGYSDRMPESMLDSGRSISVHVYELATNVPGGQEAAYGSALVLLILLAAISIAVHYASTVLQNRLLGSSLLLGR